MRMSQKALSSLSSAMCFHAQWRAALAAGDFKTARVHSQLRDEYLALAGLPSMAEIDAAFDTVNGRVPDNRAA